MGASNKPGKVNEDTRLETYNTGSSHIDWDCCKNGGNHNDEVTRGDVEDGTEEYVKNHSNGRLCWY